MDDRARFQRSPGAVSAFLVLALALVTAAYVALGGGQIRGVALGLALGGAGACVLGFAVVNAFPNLRAFRRLASLVWVLSAAAVAVLACAGLAAGPGERADYQKWEMVNAVVDGHKAGLAAEVGRACVGKDAARPCADLKAALFGRGVGRSGAAVRFMRAYPAYPAFDHLSPALLKAVGAVYAKRVDEVSEAEARFTRMKEDVLPALLLFILAAGFRLSADLAEWFPVLFFHPLSARAGGGTMPVNPMCTETETHG